MTGPVTAPVTTPVIGPVDASVIVPAYRAGTTLGACVEHLLCQRFAGSYEVIVAVSADDDDQLPRLPSDPRLKVLSHVPRLSAAAARNRGAAAAGGRMLAFTDADVMAPDGWLATLTAAAEDAPGCAVAGAVTNGTPASAVGTTEYLVQFLDLSPGRPASTAWHGATCNLLLPQELWESHGPFPEDMDGGEDTLLTVRLRGEGRFRFAPDAAVAHMNRTRLATVLRHQYEFGIFSARLARRSPLRMRFLTRFSPLAPVAAAGRVVSLYARVAAWTPSRLPRALRLLPLVAVCFGAWGWGLVLEGARLDRSLVASIARDALRRRPAVTS